MRGTTLGNVRYLVKSLVGQDLRPGVAMQADPELNTAIYLKQMWLASENDWPFLEHRWDVPMTSGTRYYDLPTTTSAVGDTGVTIGINFERPVLVETYFNRSWRPVDYGIGADEYNVNNSDGIGLTGIPTIRDPVFRWRFRTDVTDTSNPAEFEVWPVPASTGTQTIRFTGQRDPLPLYSGTDPLVWNDDALLDLDDQLVALYVAAEKLARMGSKDAPAKAALAQRRQQQVRAAYPYRTERVILGRNKVGGRMKRLVPIVLVSA